MEVFRNSVFLAIVILAVVSFTVADDEEPKKKEKKPVTKLQIGVKKRVEDCKVRSKKGDSLQMHYTVSISRIAENSKIHENYLQRKNIVTMLI